MGWCLFYGNSNCSQLISTYTIKWFDSAQSVACFQLKVSTPIYLMKVQRCSLSELFGILVPSRVNFFAWEVVWGRILTLDQLKKRWLMMSNRCYMSKGEEEMVDHILYCLQAIILWQLFYALFGIEWLMHSLVKFALLSWHRFFIGKKGKKAKGVTPLCLF